MLAKLRTGLNLGFSGLPAGEPIPSARWHGARHAVIWNPGGADALCNCTQGPTFGGQFTPWAPFHHR